MTRHRLAHKKRQTRKKKEFYYYYFFCCEFSSFQMSSTGTTARKSIKDTQYWRFFIRFAVSTWQKPDDNIYVYIATTTTTPKHATTILHSAVEKSDERLGERKNIPQESLRDNHELHPAQSPPISLPFIPLDYIHHREQNRRCTPPSPIYLFCLLLFFRLSLSSVSLPIFYFIDSLSLDSRGSFLAIPAEKKEGNFHEEMS